MSVKLQLSFSAVYGFKRLASLGGRSMAFATIIVLLNQYPECEAVQYLSGLYL